MEPSLRRPETPSQPLTPRLKQEEYMVTNVSRDAVLADIQRLRDKGVDVEGKEVTVEFEYGDNDVALADYRYANGAYYLARAYDKGVHWPGEVREFRAPNQPAEPPAGGTPPTPPAPPANRPAAPTQLKHPDTSSVKHWEALNQYERLQRQIRTAQRAIEQAKVTGQTAGVEEQRHRLEIGQKNLQQLLYNFPALTDLSRDTFPPVNLATAEGRERGRQLVMESDLPIVEKGKRVVVLHKADASVETRHPVRDLPKDKSVVRPPMRTALEDLRESQREVQHLNNQGLFAQLGNTEKRHNNLLRLQSTRRTLELLLKRFPILPGVEPQEQKNLLGLIYGVIESSKKLEQGTQSNFLSRYWNQAALREESSKITRNLKQIDQFIATHPGFI